MKLRPNQKYPFGSMNIGDKWWFAVYVKTIRSAISKYGRRHKKKFRVKQHRWNEINGCMVERIE